MLHDVSLEPASGNPQRAVIILHGLGDSAEGIIDLGREWRSALPDTVFLAPDAPQPCGHLPFGFQWFPADDWTPAVVLKGIQASQGALDAYIDHVMETRGLAAGQVALVGFSQGTMMSLYVAPRRKESLAGVLGYSGALLGGESLPREKASNPPILLVHGTHDEVVPFAAMERARQGLQSANLNVSALPCPGAGHTINDLGLREGATFLRRVLSVA